MAGLGTDMAHTCSLLDSMLHKYGITFMHRPCLPKPQEPPWVWALAARALTLVQLGVGMRLCLHVCDSQGGVQHDPSTCGWA